MKEKSNAGAVYRLVELPPRETPSGANVGYRDLEAPNHPGQPPRYGAWSELPSGARMPTK